MFTRICRKKQQIAIFGFSDTLVGRVLELINLQRLYEVCLFISVNQLPVLNNDYEHSVRPHGRTEFTKNEKIFGKPIFVGEQYIKKIKSLDIRACFVLEDDQLLRASIFDELNKNRIKILSYIDASTQFGGQNILGDGIVIFPNCYIGYKTDIHDGTIIQTNCTIEHHSRVGNFVNILPGMVTGGFVAIEDLAQINMAVRMSNRVTIGSETIIGAGSLVLDDCKPKSLYYGQPAKFVRPLDS
jgi:acetyltransferase-like isoleucine patch superfamily enzyme